jgi:integrase
MGSIRARNQQLFFDFRYQGVRCREQTLLKDTKMNRARLEKVMSDIDKAIHLGQFIYRDFFPGSVRCTEFEVIDTQTKQKQEQQTEHLTFVSNVPTFSEFSYEWMSENEVHWKQSHLANVKSILENYLLPTFGAMHLDQITRADILKLRASLAKGKTASQRSITNDRVNHIMTPLRCVLSEAALRFDIVSPFHNIKPLKIGRSNIEPFSLTEVRTFLAGVRPDFRNYYAVRFFTGMRTAEIDGLRWKYVDLANRQIIIEETLVNGRQETPKTQASYRVIQISEPVYQALSHQYDETGNNEFVFCNEEGNPLDHRNVTKRVWNPTLAMLGLKRRRPYQTRHTTATLWLAAGENPEWIAKQLGHSTTKMLFEVYSRYVPNLTRQDGSAFNSLISCN